MALGSQINASLLRSQFNNNLALGISTASGGGLDAVDSAITLSSDAFRANLAVGGPGSFGAGGAINAGQSSTLTGKADSFISNQATGGNGVNSYSGGSGQGGAIYLSGSQASFIASSFRINLSRGGIAASGPAGNGDGGAIEALNSTLTLSTSVFALNQAIGGAIGIGTTGGSGDGGALYSNPASGLTITSSTIEFNNALGQTGYGGGIYFTGTGQGTVSKVKFLGNYAVTAGSNVYGP